MSSAGESLSVDAALSTRRRLVACHFSALFIFCFLVFDKVQLLALEMILVLGLLVGANDAGGEGLEDVGSAGQEAGWCGRGGGHVIRWVRKGLRARRRLATRCER